MTSRSYTVDDADGQIQYSDGWTRAGSLGSEFNATTALTRKGGASFRFTFLGTSVKVFGTLSKFDPKNTGTFPNTSYILDDGDPVPFFGQPSHTETLYHQLFYATPPLQYAVHTLIGTCVDEGSEVYIDYLEIKIPLGFPTSIPGSTTSVQTGSQTTRPATPIIASPTSDSQATSPTTAIIGGVLGTLVFVLTSISIYIWHRQYRRTKIQKSTVCFRPAAFPRGSGITTTTNQGVLLSVEHHSSLLPQQHHRDDYHVSVRLPPTQVSDSDNGFEAGARHVVPEAASYTDRDSVSTLPAYDAFLPTV